MSKKSVAKGKVVDILVLKTSCQALHQAILGLPRDAIRDRLFIAVLKVREHLHRRHFILAQRSLVTMRELISTSADYAPVLLALQRLEDQLEVFLRSPLPAR